MEKLTAYLVDDKINKAVGTRIQELRLAAGLSQEKFALSIGMARTYFAEVETGKRNVSIRNLQKIIKGLDTTFPVFFTSDYFKL